MRRNEPFEPFFASCIIKLHGTEEKKAYSMCHEISFFMRIFFKTKIIHLKFFAEIHKPRMIIQLQHQAIVIYRVVDHSGDVTQVSIVHSLVVAGI
jgi:hypothetical protein